MVWQSETQSNKLSGDTVGIPLAPGNVLLKIILTGGRKILYWGEEGFTPGGNMQSPAEIPCVYKKKKKSGPVSPPENFQERVPSLGQEPPVGRTGGAGRW